MGIKHKVGFKNASSDTNMTQQVCLHFNYSVTGRTTVRSTEYIRYAYASETGDRLLTPLPISKKLPRFDLPGKSGVLKTNENKN